MQTFMRNGRHMSLEQAQQFDATGKTDIGNPVAPKTPKAPSNLKKKAPKAKAVPKALPSEAVLELRKKLDEKKIKYHHMAGEDKLKELLDNHKE